MRTETEMGVKYLQAKEGQVTPGITINGQMLGETRKELLGSMALLTF